MTVGSHGAGTWQRHAPSQPTIQQLIYRRRAKVSDAPRLSLLFPAKLGGVKPSGSIVNRPKSGRTRLDPRMSTVHTVVALSHEKGISFHSFRWMGLVLCTTSAAVPRIRCRVKPVRSTSWPTDLVGTLNTVRNAFGNDSALLLLLLVGPKMRTKKKKETKQVLWNSCRVAEELRDIHLRNVAYEEYHCSPKCSAMLGMGQEENEMHPGRRGERRVDSCLDRINLLPSVFQQDTSKVLERLCVTTYSPFPLCIRPSFIVSVMSADVIFCVTQIAAYRASFAYNYTYKMRKPRTETGYFYSYWFITIMFRLFAPILVWSTFSVTHTFDLTWTL